MNNRVSQLATITATFAIGFVAGIMLAPSSGKKLREDLGEQARQKLDIAEKKLAVVEQQLAEVNERIGTTTNEWTDKLRSAAEDKVGEHLPDLSLTDEKWDLEESDIKQGLRHMTRG